jgi:Leucine-rich repeat (LRR) protein
LKNIKNLNLSNNKINEGVNEFIGSISNLCKKLTLEKLSDSILFDYSDTLMTKFHYWIKDDEIDILEKFPFDGIIDLLIKGFEDTGLKFLSNESLKDLEDLDLKDNNIKTLNMFNKISFTGIKKIKLVNTFLCDDSLDNIKAFPSIEIKSITIENNGVHFTFINPELELSINNFNILLDDLIEKSELNDKIKINGIPKDNELFSYNNFRDKKLAIFKDIKVEEMDLSFKDGKYLCQMKFKPLDFQTSFDLDDLTFMKSDDILSEISCIKLNNITIDKNLNFETDKAFENLKSLTLNHCLIDDAEVFEQINNKINNNDLKVYSYETKCNNNNHDLIQSINKDIFVCKEILHKIKYIKPFDFFFFFDSQESYDVLKTVYLKSTEIIDLSDSGLNNISFLKNDSLVNLKTLLLDKNNIEDISILTDENIYFHDLEKLDLRNNPIKTGLEVLKQNFFKKCSYILILIDDDNIKVQFKDPNYYLDIINDGRDVLGFFENDKIRKMYNVREMKDIHFYDSCYEKKLRDEYDKKYKYDNKKDSRDSDFEITIKSMNKSISKWFYDYYDNDFENEKEDIKSDFNKLLPDLENDKKISYLFSESDIYLNSNKFAIIFPDFDLNKTISYDNLRNLTTIELSDLLHIDIKLLCESEYFANIKILKLCDNEQILNINCLATAKFVGLNELYLNNNFLSDIDFLGECPFGELAHLDCSNNNISLIPKLNFPNLNYFNLKDNKLEELPDVENIGGPNCTFILLKNKLAGFSDFLSGKKKIIIIGNEF